MNQPIKLKQLDANGRITIPSACRKQAGVKTKDCLEFFLDFEKIVLEKQYTRCVFCKSREKLWEFRKQSICDDCRRGMKESCEIKY